MTGSCDTRAGSQELASLPGNTTGEDTWEAHVEIDAVRPPTLIGVGVGPGDPKLMTLKAVQVFRDADRILVPSTEAAAEGPGRAEQIVVAACPWATTKLRRVPFSMARRTGADSRRRQAWETSAQAVVEAFQQGVGTVAFATIGDPSLYSTFSYLVAQTRTAVPDLEVSLVPGITAMQNLAAASLTPLVEGREALTLVPLTAGLDAVEAALEHSETVVAYKVGGRLAELMELVKRHDRTGVLGVDIGLPGQQLLPLSEVTTSDAPYFTTVLVTPERTAPGGQL